MTPHLIGDIIDDAERMTGEPWELMCPHCYGRFPKHRVGCPWNLRRATEEHTRGIEALIRRAFGRAVGVVK